MSCKGLRCRLAVSKRTRFIVSYAGKRAFGAFGVVFERKPTLESTTPQARHIGMRAATLVRSSEAHDACPPNVCDDECSVNVLIV
jgi:hypothetical protein